LRSGLRLSFYVPNWLEEAEKNTGVCVGKPLFVGGGRVKMEKKNMASRERKAIPRSRKSL